MQRYPVFTALMALFICSGCISESTYVANERQVTQRNVDNNEAAKTRIALGLNYLRRGDTTQALFNLERARIMAPNLPEVYNALALYYQAVGEHLQADKSFRQALSKDTHNADTYNNYGAFLCQIGNYSDAEQLLLSAIAKPGYIRVAESYENLALCQLEQAQFEQALNYINQSIMHNATRSASLLNRASILYAMGSLAAARQDLLRIQNLGAGSAASTLLDYLVLASLAELSGMREAKQQLLRHYPDSIEAGLLLEDRVSESEFEKLRVRYKQRQNASVKEVLKPLLPVAIVSMTARFKRYTIHLETLRVQQQLKTQPELKAVLQPHLMDLA